MKKIFSMLWITLLASLARGADWGLSSSDFSPSEINPSAFVGDGTGTCAAANAFVGDGTGTCAAAINIEYSTRADEVMNINVIRDSMMNPQAEIERRMVLEKVLGSIQSEEK